ncbi:MAG: RNA 2',3'-cyclic phosphodiesterase [Candidatus Aenigmatarchaeota archaeon]
MRAFIAVLVSEGLKTRIEKVQESIDLLDIDVKLVEPENLHYNLKFLGELNEDDVNRVKTVLDRVVPQYRAFDLHVTGLGAFPQLTYAKVVWLGAKEGANQLSAIAESVELALSDAGFGAEERPFTPHLTLARINGGQQKTELIALLKDKSDVDIGTVRVHEVVLFKSELTPNGPVYTPMYRVKLS